MIFPVFKLKCFCNSYYAKRSSEIMDNITINEGNMKPKTILLLLVVIAIQMQAQISVNTDGSQPDNSAMLDVKSTAKGMLVPRMTVAQRNGISNPARGLIIFCTDDNLYYFNRGTPALPLWWKLNSPWATYGPNIYYPSGNVGIGEPNPAYPLNFSSTVGDKISFYGTTANHYGFGIQEWQFQIHSDYSTSDITFGYGSSAAFTEVARIKGNGQVAIGTATPAGSAILDLTSVSRGLLIPRMGKFQRDAILSPEQGLCIYNTYTGMINVFNGTYWSNPDGSTADAGWSCGMPITDSRDGRKYQTVDIGSQCWMAQNLNIGNMVDGASNQLNNGIVEKYCYNNDESNCNTYGGLYQWTELMQYVATEGTQGLCPSGWHIPTHAEWTMLSAYLGNAAGGKMKDLNYWIAPNTGATNSSGFNGLPGGYLWLGVFRVLTDYGDFSSSTQYSQYFQRDWNLASNTAILGSGTVDFRQGISCRCLRD